MATGVEEATTLRQQFAATQQRIEGDRAMTPAAKAERIAAAREATNVKLANLRTAQAQAVETERSALLRRLSSPPASSTLTPSDRIARDASYRDALERAEGAADLSRLFERARQTGDDLQSQAVLAVALARGDGRVLTAYAEVDPAVRADLDRLEELSQGHSSLQTLERAIQFGGV